MLVTLTLQHLKVHNDYLEDTDQAVISKNVEEPAFRSRGRPRSKLAPHARPQGGSWRGPAGGEHLLMGLLPAAAAGQPEDRAAPAAANVHSPLPHILLSALGLP